MRIRIGVLLLATISCGPRWTLEDRTSSSSITVDPGMTFAKDVDIEASHPISSVRTVADHVSVKSGRIRVTQTDARQGCNAARTFQGVDGLWNDADTDAGTKPINLTADRLELSSTCPATEHATKVGITFTNEGDAGVTLDWQVVATTTGEGSDDPPGDAFIRVRPAQ